VSATPIVLVEESRALPLVHLTVAGRTGAAEDPDGKEGLTRFLARLMRRTGAGMDSQALDIRIDSLGGSLGADVSHSVTGFHGTVIARSLDAFVDLLIDVIARPGFSPAELERLRRESQAEIVESRDNDRALAQRWFRRKLFEGHSFGRPVEGLIGSIGRIEQADVREHYARLWATENLVFAFAGAIDEAGAQSIAERLRRTLPAGSRRVDAISDPSLPPGRRLVIVDKPERTQTQILVGALGSHPHDADHTALHVANTVFGGTFTARMTEEIRTKRGWSYGAYSSLPYDRHRQSFSMWTFPKANDAAACIRLQLEMLANWRNAGITAEELAWAKRYLVRSHAFSVDTAPKRVGLRFDEIIYELPAGYHQHYVERVEAVTLEQANTAVSQRIDDRNLLVVVVGTESQIGAGVRDAIDGLSSVEVVPHDTDG
jgi:zinc protease